MREPHDVIISPVVTEKTAEQMDQKSLYTFIVSRDANKIEIGQAVEKLWDVNVVDVRTMRYPGKTRRSFLGRMAKNGGAGRRPSFKKAIVQLAAGEHIELYEVG
ncbi:MAG TPA: 50S ribosomal protein L23 [Longimicrobiales bacterium]|nr:50S ribosomal protein L23 [Longimicrobiales bacterium]